MLRRFRNSVITVLLLVRIAPSVCAGERDLLNDWWWKLNRTGRRALHLWAQQHVPKVLPKAPDWVPRAEPPRFTFVVVSDLHYHTLGKHNWARRTKQIVLNALHFINDTVKPDLVVGTGDLIASEEKEQLEEFKQLVAAELKCRFVPVVGNHDGARYQEVFGKATGSFTHKGVHFITLGLLYTDYDNGWARFPDMEWLKEDIASHAKEPTLVFVHNPVFPSSFTKAPTVKQMLQDNRQCVGVFQGHFHEDYWLEFNGVTYIGMPALCGRERGLKVCNVYDDLIVVRTAEVANGKYRYVGKWQRIPLVREPGIKAGTSASPRSKAAAAGAQ